ncbi:magnesium and cobalt transport protein CorA [Erwinia sp. HDF1-3R]|uniref:magnesium and cobalt transport protein CorA n=1 Tax=Erwinia sp. HDF1-3R TaxID=3141543 RepID=UPI0031F54DAD
MIVNSRVYHAGRHGEEVDIDNISEVLKEPDAFIWLGLLHPDAQFMHRIQKEFGLHDLAIEDALTAHQRTKIEHYGDSVFIVVKTARDAKDGTIHFGETHIFIGKNFLITVRHGASDRYSSCRKRAEENPDMLAMGPGYALYCILDFIVDNYAELTMSLSGRITDIEEAMFRSDFDKNAVQKVYVMRRHLLALRNSAMPVVEICNQLVRLHDELIPKPLKAYIRDVEDHASHVVSDAEDMREMLTTAMQMNLALVSVQQNEVGKKLAGWGAILIVPTVMFSMYGMNFEHMPELHTHYGYPAVVACTFSLCTLLWWKLRRTGWL